MIDILLILILLYSLIKFKIINLNLLNNSIKLFLKFHNLLYIDLLIY